MTDLEIHRYYNYYIWVIKSLQHDYESLILCGSYPLMIDEKMPKRWTQDVDFVLNAKDFEKLRQDDRLTVMNEDHYVQEINKKDKYKSYHSFFRPYAGGATNANVNFLVFDDEVELEYTYICGENAHLFKSQPIDTILQWKQKYNRKKDKEDLNNIANKEIEAILAEKMEEQ